MLLEALASGTTVLASDLEAFRLVLEEGRDGALFSTGDPASLAAGVSELLADPRRRQRLAADGLVRAKQFDWATVVRDIMRVYESVVTPGVPVQADLSEQLLGRWARRAKVDE